MNNLIQAAAVLFAASTAHAQQAVQWKVSDGGNGHWYGTAEAIDWSVALAEAASRGAHLATPTSSAENHFVTQRLLTTDRSRGWIGLEQVDDQPTPDAGWRWVTDEALGWTNWLCFGGSLGCAPDDSPCFAQPWQVEDNQANCATMERNGTWDDLEKGPWCDGGSRIALIEWSADCNNDGIVDYGQIRSGQLADLNGNGIPDCCEQDTGCDQLATGLQAYLEFDGDCLDSSMFGRNGAPTGIQFARDRFNALNKSASFDGVTTDVQIQGIPIPSDNAFSWSLWLRIEPMAYGISGVPILQRIDSVGNNLMSPSLWLRADGRLSFISYLIGPGGWDLDTPPASVLPGTWVHVACTSATSGDRRIYLDGALVAQGVAPSYGQELGLLLVGRDRLDSNPRLRASIDELRVYSRALSAAEVLAVRDVGGPVAPTCSDADIYRDFNVNGADLGILLSQWGPNTPLTESDLNNDGAVDGADLGILLSFWGPCP